MAAALFGIEVVVRLGYKRVHIEGDAIDIIRDIDHGDVGCSHIHMFLDNNLRLVAQFEGFCCGYVSRSGNVLVHRVARWDIGPGIEKLCMNSFLQELLALVDIIQ